MNPYIGHSSQFSGIEEHRLIGGRGDGMRLFLVRNGLGLEFTVSADRCADLSRLSFKGQNYGYMAACGYVSPSYYDGVSNGFLKSFTAGFLTTCGLNAVGTPCEDAGEQLPLHGTISNAPAEYIWHTEDAQFLTIHAVINDSGLFSRKLRLIRTYTVSKTKNTLRIHDDIFNEGDTPQPVEILYHLNIGYPLLSESSELYIPSEKVTPRNTRAAEGIDSWAKLLPPTPQFEEQCYYHSFKGDGLAAIYSPILDSGLAIRFDSAQLSYFTEWKMMGVRDYVLGLEPGNCHADGRDKMRADGTLTELAAGKRISYDVFLEMLDGKAAFQKLKEM